MKEVTLFSDDAKSRESAQQLGQVCFSMCELLEFRQFLEHAILKILTSERRFYGYHICLAGSFFIKSLTTSKYSAVLWFRDSKFLKPVGLTSSIVACTSLVGLIQY